MGYGAPGGAPLVPTQVWRFATSQTCYPARMGGRGGTGRRRGLKIRFRLPECRFESGRPHQPRRPESTTARPYHAQDTDSDEGAVLPLVGVQAASGTAA